MKAMIHFRLVILLHSFCFALASQAKAAHISPGDALQEHVAQNIRAAQSLLADADDQPGFSGPPGVPMARPVMAAPAQMGAAKDFDLTSFQMSLPLDVGIRLQSDDGVWFSSKAKSRDDKNYDTNSVLRLPLKLYDKITGSA